MENILKISKIQLDGENLSYVIEVSHKLLEKEEKISEIFKKNLKVELKCTSNEQNRKIYKKWYCSNNIK